MSILFYTDPHLGLERSAHTTPASRLRLKEAVYSTCYNVVMYSHQGVKVCLGDFFDKYRPDYNDVLDSWPIFHNTQLILYGNHDLANRVDSVSALKLMHAFDPVRDASLVVEDLDTEVVPVHHELSQAVFEDSLRHVCSLPRRTRIRILALHCNYESPHDLGDASLNLTRACAEELLKHFDYVLLGHEHQCRMDFDGRLIVLGNLHPTSFSDISDKYCWEFDGTAFHRHSVWREETGLCRISWEDLPDLSSTAGWQFIDVFGECEPGQLPEINRQINDLWRDHSSLLMLRNRVTTVGVAMPEPEMISLSSIPERITLALSSSPLLPLWKAFLGKIQSTD